MKNNDDIKKLLEAFDRTEQWRGEDPNPPNGKLVGESDKFLGGHFNSDDQVREEEGVAGAERNREMGHAKIDLIQGREGEQRRVWQQHYDRAIRNGRDKARARQYADSMTGSEAVFNGEGEEITEREAGAGYGDNTQRGTPPWMMPGSDGGDGNNGKKTSFQLAGDEEEENIFVDEEVVDEYGADVANDMATPDVQPQVAQRQQPKTYGDVRGNLSPAARNMFAQRELAKLSQHDQENNPFESVDSSKYATTEELAEALTKAYEDYVGDPYSENNVIPKAAKKPGKDMPKAKKAKREPAPNELAEDEYDEPKKMKKENFVCPKCNRYSYDYIDAVCCPKCGSAKPPLEKNVTEMFPNRDSGSTDAENRAWERRFKKVQAAKMKARAAKAKKEKPFKDAAATGNPRDFANESEKITELAKWRKEGGKGGATGLGKTFVKQVTDYGDRKVKVPIGRQGLDQDSEPIDNSGRDPLSNRSKLKISTSGKPLTTKNANRNLKDRIRQDKGKHGPVGPLPEATKGKKSENRELWDRIKARGTTRGVDKERYTDMSGEGLEGPFPQKNGQVLYYDPKEGKYYNRDTDMYVDQSDYDAMNEAGKKAAKKKEVPNDYAQSDPDTLANKPNKKVYKKKPEHNDYAQSDPDAGYDDDMFEGDPAIPAEVHDRNKAKDREAFQRNFARGAGERTKRAVDAGVQQFMKRPVKSEPAAVGESSGRFAQLARLRAKFESVSNKLKELKGQRALKEAPINQVVAPAGTPQQQTTATGQPVVKPQPINTAQSPAQQAPVQAPAGTPTAVPAPGQPAPPAAGQPGGAPVQAPGTPAPPGQGATNAATTPGEQMKGFVQSLSNNPAGAKQLATKLNTVR